MMVRPPGSRLPSLTVTALIASRERRREATLRPTVAQVKKRHSEARSKKTNPRCHVLEMIQTRLENPVCGRHVPNADGFAGEAARANEDIAGASNR